MKRRAFAVPLTNPAYPCGPHRFRNRKYLTTTYRSVPEASRWLVSGPSEPDDGGLVSLEFMKMPDSTGFGA